MKPQKPLLYRPDIDGLRAAAVLAVVGFHAFPAWVPGGFVGVDIFFVISGFLITGLLLSQLHTQKFSLAGFYARRIRRIFPGLLVVLFATLGFGYFFLWPDEYFRLSKHAAGGAGFIVNFLVENEAGYFDPNAETKPLLHLWSLGVEEQFYILWPLMLWAAWKIKRRVGLMIALVITASFAANLWFAWQNATIDFYSPFTRFWEILAGGLLAWNSQGPSQRKTPRLVSEGLGLVGLTLITVSVFALTPSMTFPSWIALLPVLGTIAVIAAGQHSSINRWVLGNPAVVYIGLISYPLYLWHWPLLSYARILWGEDAPRTLRVAMLALSFGLAMLTYILIEQPIRRRPITKTMIIILVMLMMAIAEFGVGVCVSRGMPARFSAFGSAETALGSENMIAEWEDNVRFHTCHLQDQDEEFQTANCYERTRPLLLLWGDSHAASLYPGLKNLQKSATFGITQLTQSSCPPLFDLPEFKNRPNCAQINDRILKQATQLKPDVIVLDSAWVRDDYPIKRVDIVARINHALANIKRSVPNAKIIVVGPTPRWLSPLPAIYRDSFMLEHSVPPARSFEHIDQNIAGLDMILGDQMSKTGVRYLSPQKFLCNRSGCLTRFTDSFNTLTFVDEEHLTSVASEHFIDAVAPEILSALAVSDQPKANAAP